MRINKDFWLINRPIAHRGLWNENIIENSVTAYQNAVENGYPIEIDVHQTKDGHLVSFHDDNLKRMTGVDAFIHQKTLNELQQLSLLKSNEKIPTFEQVLSICENKVPLLIELKDQPSKDFVDKVVKRLKQYSGEFAVQSFNPLYIIRVKKLAPEFIRGILGTVSHGKNKSAFTRKILKDMPLNFLAKPDFISYSFEDLPLKKRKLKNKRLICWTITNEIDFQKAKQYAENVIFEHFIPNSSKLNKNSNK